MSTKRCPLSSGSAPGFYFAEKIPGVCIERCEALWEKAIVDTIPDHEEYPSYLFPNNNCSHYATEHGNSSLQAVAIGSSVRLYGLTERCMGCSEEIAEDSFEFQCPTP